MPSFKVECHAHRLTVVGLLLLQIFSSATVVTSRAGVLTAPGLRVSFQKVPKKTNTKLCHAFLQTYCSHSALCFPNLGGSALWKSGCSGRLSNTVQTP